VNVVNAGYWLIYILFLFCAAKMKKNQKEKSSSPKTIRALRFSLMTGLSELGL